MPQFVIVPDAIRDKILWFCQMLRQRYILSERCVAEIQICREPPFPDGRSDVPWASSSVMEYL
jgi:hypothetical protein